MASTSREETDNHHDHDGDNDEHNPHEDIPDGTQNEDPNDPEGTAEGFDGLEVKAINPSNKWDFVTFTKHNYHVTPQDDKRMRIRNVIINAISWITIALGVVVLQIGYSGSKGYFMDTAAQVIKIVINALSVILIGMLIEYRFLNIRIDMRKWQAEDIRFSFRSRTCMLNMRFMIVEILFALPQPIAFIPRVDKLALLLVLRLIFITRLVRDFHPLYRRRREIWKDARLQYCHNPERFNTLAVFRMFFKQHTAIVVTFFAIFVSAVGSYAFYVGDREKESINWLDWFYFTVITATTVGYGDIDPKTTVTKVVAMIIAVSGTILTALLVGAVTAALTPSDFQKEAATWLSMEKHKEERQEYSAQFIQLVFRRYMRKKRYYNTRNAREERKYNRKCIRLITRLRHLRKAAQWTKIASMHPLQNDLDDLQNKYESLQIELRNTNAKLDLILRALNVAPVQQGGNTKQLTPPAPPSSDPSLPTDNLTPATRNSSPRPRSSSVAASPPTF